MRCFFALPRRDFLHLEEQALLRGGAIDVRKTWRECIEAPAELKSFTFARLTLMPALQKPPSYVREDYNNLATAESCNVEEFFLSVLAEFSSHYLEVLSVFW